MISERTKQVLWRKFRQNNYSADFLNYVLTISKELYNEMEEVFYINLIDQFKKNTSQQKKIFTYTFREPISLK